MANVTLSIDDELLRKGREYAASRGTTLNALVRTVLSDLTSRSDTEIEEIMARLRSSSGVSKGDRFNREDLYEERI